MHIRLARPEDITILSEYWYDQMAIWQQGSSKIRVLPGGRQQWEAAAHGYLHMPDAVFLVAQAANEVVGGIVGAVVANEPGLAPHRIGLVQALIVDNHTEHGRGAGGLLLEAWTAQMRQRGIEQIRVHVPAHAPVQQAFWRGVGASNVMDVFWMGI